MTGHWSGLCYLRPAWSTAPDCELPMQRRTAFTLTELLVSLSILAVLSAMAIPALRGALDRADRTVSFSNLRQIGQAMTEYIADQRRAT